MEWHYMDCGDCPVDCGRCGMGRKMDICPVVRADDPTAGDKLPENVKVFWKWNPDTDKYDIPYGKTLVRPDQWDRRGGPICAVCGGKTRTVLDGEAWCDNCGRYQ
jgi:hypothetical protein